MDTINECSLFTNNVLIFSVLGNFAKLLRF